VPIFLSLHTILNPNRLPVPSHGQKDDPFTEKSFRPFKEEEIKIFERSTSFIFFTHFFLGGRGSDFVGIDILSHTFLKEGAFFLRRNVFDFVGVDDPGSWLLVRGSWF
jgi:hypothetical protein